MMEILYLSPQVKFILYKASKFLFKSEREKIIDALYVFDWQCTETHTWTDDFEKATYCIIIKEEYDQFQQKYSKTFFLRSLNRKFEIIFENKTDLQNAIKAFKGIEYKWIWKYSETNPGYEVTTRGDRRFSPFCMKFVTADGVLMSQEEYYQKIMKPMYDSGQAVRGDGWGHRMFKQYLDEHPGLLYELALIGSQLPFSDMFDKDGGQNKMWSEILNELISSL